MFDENNDPSWPQRVSVKLRPREGLSLLSSTAGGSHERYPHQMGVFPDPASSGQARGPGSRAWGSEGTGHLTCQGILGRTQLLPPGSRPGRWMAPWASGPERHTRSHPGERGWDRTLRRLGGGSGSWGWESPGSWGWVSGLRTLGVVTPCLSPSLAPCCPRSAQPSLPTYPASSPGPPHIHPRWRLLPGFQRPLPSVP